MTEVTDLLAYIESSPSPYHAVAESVRRLSAAGFTPWDPSLSDPDPRGSRYWVRGGSLVAWIAADGHDDQPFRVIGAHTDSPNLRVKPHPDLRSAGFRELAVEVYGGALWNSWLDRDLGISGRVVLSTTEGLVTRLFRVDEPLLRVPQLAIHLDRDVNNVGLKLNPQVHLNPVWGLAAGDDSDFQSFLARRVGATRQEVMAWDAMLHDLTPPSRFGAAGEFLAAPRIDNLLSCWAGTEALVRCADRTADSKSTPVLCMFDHEEVGSTSATGADGTLLGTTLEQVVLSRGGDRASFLSTLARSVCLSADGAHGTHPNFPERHDPGHPISLDGGPVIKVNANQRYASDAETVAIVVDAARRAGVPHQFFVSRNDQPCGSTIGPLTAARLGIRTVDVGVAQLSMHSAREMCGAKDPLRFVDLLTSFATG
ncbi:MAG: M18 family aminopeptidase [Acidimicrobiales bacterium]|nr:M18 family aminopeptidase [Acidimicrobiales bacterium]